MKDQIETIFSSIIYPPILHLIQRQKYFSLYFDCVFHYIGKNQHGETIKRNLMIHKKCIVYHHPIFILNENTCIIQEWHKSTDKLHSKRTCVSLLYQTEMLTCQCDYCWWRVLPEHTHTHMKSISFAHFFEGKECVTLLYRKIPVIFRDTVIDLLLFTSTSHVSNVRHVSLITISHLSKIKSN